MLHNARPSNWAIVLVLILVLSQPNICFDKKKVMWSLAEKHPLKFEDLVLELVQVPDKKDCRSKDL